MPFHVYILYSVRIKKPYVGFTSDLEARVTSHNLSTKGWTVRGRPWILIYTEEFGSKAEAMDREKVLKSGKGRVIVKGIVREYLQLHGAVRSSLDSYPPGADTGSSPVPLLNEPSEYPSLGTSGGFLLLEIPVRKKNRKNDLDHRSQFFVGGVAKRRSMAQENKGN